MTHGSLFSGIGGFDLAAEWAGWENKFHCEWNEFGQRVLRYYWPNATSYGDITQTDFTVWKGRIDVITGGFPCQPYSTAGKRLGKEDERHLWPEMLRAIREIQPRYVVGENVPGLINWSGGMVFEEVQSDLEAAGYEVIPFILPACGVNAPHRRDRIWFIAFKNTNKDGRRSYEREEEPNVGQFWNTCTGDNERLSTNNGEIRTTTDSHCNGFDWSISQHEINAGKRRVDALGITFESHDDGFTSDTSSTGREELDVSTFSNGEGHSCRCSNAHRTNWQDFPTQSPVCTGDDWLPGRLDGITFSKWRNESVKACGNAVVPQVVYQIFKAINEYENQ